MRTNIEPNKLIVAYFIFLAIGAKNETKIAYYVSVCNARPHGSQRTSGNY
jgi:hypothetical protein